MYCSWGMPYVLALDQGTTSSRAILFDEEGAVRASAQREFEQLYPQRGSVEHRPQDIWSSLISVAIEALSRAGARPRDIKAIGITNQRETTIIWDRKTGEPIANAIVWQDRRTASICDLLRQEGLEGPVREKTGLLIDAYFSGTKIMWLLDHVPGARAKAEKGELAFGTVDSWLLWNLTSGSVHRTDVTNASRTMLFNIHTLQWDRELLEAMRIPSSLLPEVRSSSERFAAVSTTLGLSDIPICGVAGDQHAALFGQTCFEAGTAKCTYGTGAFLLQNMGETAKPSAHRLLTTIAWQLRGRTEYALEGSIFTAGSVVQWLRDGLGIIKSSSEVEELARSVPDAGGVYLVPAFTGLGAPHWDPHARGSLLGLTRGTTGGHIARGALEGIAFQVADLLEAMQSDSGLPVRELRVDGGAASNNLLMQFQADLLQIPLLRPAVTETTSLGAAYLAGLAAGFWGNEEAIRSHWKLERTFTPERKPDEVQLMRERWAKAVERSRNWSDDSA